MRLHRFYIEQKIEDKKEVTISDTDLIHQISNVFRLKAGNQVIVFDGSGLEYICEIVSLTKKELVLKIVRQGDSSALGGVSLSRPRVSLYLALIKKGNFELAVEKCTEVGVAEIQPVISERSEKKDLNLERLNKIVKEASEQSGRLTLPVVSPIINLAEAVSQVVKENKRGVVFHTELVADETGQSKTNHPVHQKHLPSPTQDSSLPGQNRQAGLEKEEKGDIAMFVGCEGGWTDKEMELFQKNNFEIRSLGPNILRAETAAILAVWEGLKIL